MSKLELYNAFLSNTSWLYVKIYQNDWFFFDLWSVVHFGSGVVFYLLIHEIFRNNTSLIFVGVLLVYELFEIFLLYFMVRVILPETFKDQLTDVLVGLVGGFFGNLYLRLHTVYKPYIRLFFLSGVFGYLYVGFYYFLPALAQLKNLNLDITVLFKVFLFSYLSMLVAEIYLFKINNILQGILIPVFSIVIISLVFATWINLPEIHAIPMLFYAVIIINSDYFILFLVKKWKARAAFFKKSSISDYYSV